MNIIIKKVRLVAAPLPPFVGTRIAIRTTDTQRTFGFTNLVLGDGHANVTVDWGDGKVETFASISKVTHDYAATGEYEVRISDDLKSLSVSASMSGSPFYDEYPKLVERVHSNAQSLTKTGLSFLARCTNLTSVDLGDSAIAAFQVHTFAFCESLTAYRLPKGLTSLGTQMFRACPRLTSVNLPEGITDLTSMSFRDCTALSGDIALPFVSNITTDETNAPFVGCPNITAFHFAAQNESAIRASEGFRTDPTLGTGSAVCVFDL